MASYELNRSQVRFILDGVAKQQEATLKKIYNVDKMKNLIEPELYDEIMQSHQADLHFISDTMLSLTHELTE